MPLPPLNDPSWDVLVVQWDSQPWQSPGTVTVDPHRKIGWDKKAAQGQVGASSERKGEPLKEFTATHKLTDMPQTVNGTVIPSEIQQWDVWEFLLAQSYGVDPPKALSIYHPDLYAKGIEAASVEDIGPMVRDDTGGATIAVKWLEFRPPTTTGKGGGSGGGAVDPDDEPDGRTETDDAIEKALAEIDKLQKEGDEL